MGDFIGHVVPGTLFLLVGLWHLWSGVFRYVSNPKSFRVRVWSPLPGRFKYLELYLIVVGCFIDMWMELAEAKPGFFVNGILNPDHMNNFEHSGMLLMFFLYGLIILLSQKTSFLPIPNGAICLVVATAFSSQYFLFYYHSTTHKGLEGYYHLVLFLLIALCIVSTIASALFPTSFPVDLCSGFGYALQGLWFYQTAFTLYGPLMPSGCQVSGDHVISCQSKEHEVQGELFANVQLFVSVFGLVVAIVASYGFAASRYGNHPDLTSLHAADD